MSQERRSGDVVGARTGEYTPAGEGQGQNSTFSAQQVADAFRVEIGRVHNAFQGEFGLGSDGAIGRPGRMHYLRLPVACTCSTGTRSQSPSFLLTPPEPPTRSAIPP